MVDPEPAERRHLLAKRDHLLKELRLRRTSGVVSAGLGRRAGGPVLTVLVNSGFKGDIPPSYEGVDVMVTCIGDVQS